MSLAVRVKELKAVKYLLQQESLIDSVSVRERVKEAERAIDRAVGALLTADEEMLEHWSTRGPSNRSGSETP